MDVDPLQDVSAPRHEIESDSEDDFDSPPKARKLSSLHLPKIEVTSSPSLTVLIGAAGEEWLRHVSSPLRSDGIKAGHLQIGDVSVGTKGDVIVSVNHTLSSTHAHELAAEILRTYKPKTLVILDSYSIPTYISSSPPSILNAPIRVLQTTYASNHAPPTPSLKPFNPPNLIQSSLTASLLSHLEPSSSIPATALLLPSKHVPPHITPSSSEPVPLRNRSSNSSAYADVEEWDLDLLEEVTRTIKGLGAAGDVEWSVEVAREVRKSGYKGSRRGDIGEGGMYI